MDAVLNGTVILLGTVATLVLVAAGLAVIFGFMRIINFAHGEFVALGAFAVLVCDRNGIPFPLAVVIATLVGAIFGLIVERLLIRPLYGRLVDTLLVTFALSLLLQQGYLIGFGTSPAGIGSMGGSWKVGQYFIPQYQLFLIVMTGVLVGVLWWVFTRTMYGARARAASSAPSVASTLGMDPVRINAATFTLGSACAAFAGALLTPVIAVQPFMGVSYLPLAFLTVVTGGAAPLTGTTAAGSLLGVSQYTASVLTNPFLGTVAVLVVAMVVLRFLPQGMSAKWRSKV
ncbi:hypothetical protein [Actinomadura sp. B10D3]|uniref:branched-chain amino acid ABC transporter permease n=1 Tax=Actinomadura sp. B10D3 TaxID=3153557 RepID=UPI00325E628B